MEGKISRSSRCYLATMRCSSPSCTNSCNTPTEPLSGAGESLEGCSCNPECNTRTEGRKEKNLQLIATLVRPFLGLSQNGNKKKNGVKSPFYWG